jgi:hypothetical protein
LQKRPGALIWLVAQDFTLQPSSNSTTTAITAGLLGSPVTPLQLTTGTSYSAGVWVSTPQIGSGPDAVADPYYNYVDAVKGAEDKFAYVLQDFIYQPNQLSVKDYFDQLVELGVIHEIIVRNADQGLPIYKYKPRFPATTYLEFRETSVSAPQYFVAAEYFTPDTAVITDLVSEGLVIPLAYTPDQRIQLEKELVSGTVNTPARMFRFFKGDTTIFRQNSTVISYTATTNVSPLFDFSVYLENGVFVLSAEFDDPTILTLPFIPFFNPEYSVYSEDTILAEDGRNMYRVMRAFTPPKTVTNWTNTVSTNTARNEEYAGNLLRYVNMYACEEKILSQFGRDISAIKLGIAQISLVPKNADRYSNTSTTYTYVWEDTATAIETPQLSWFPGTTYTYTPPNYRNGTMNL